MDVPPREETTDHGSENGTIRAGSVRSLQTSFQKESNGPKN
jgi:hypothetical protein